MLNLLCALLTNFFVFRLARLRSRSKGCINSVEIIIINNNKQHAGKQLLFFKEMQGWLRTSTNRVNGPA